jgi:DNA-binding transcriptional LysR family regulator
MPRSIRWEKNIGRRLQLRDLQVFFTVAEQGSMAKAAAQLGVTQPSISAVIAALEDSLGAPLFDRSTRGVELTAVGRTLLGRGRAAFDELRQGIREIEFLKKPDVGEVKIGCPENIAACFLPEVIDRLAKQHPGVSLAVENLATPTLEFRELSERKLDLVLALLASSDHRRPLPDYTVEVLFEDRLCIVVGSRSPLARRRTIDVAELSQLPWVIGPADSPGTSWVAQMFRAANADLPERRITTYSSHLRFAMAATGRFVATMSESAFNYGARRYGLKKLSVSLPAPRWPVAAVTLRNRNLSSVVDLFLDCARDVARSDMKPSPARHHIAKH